MKNETLKPIQNNNQPSEDSMSTIPMPSREWEMYMREVMKKTAEKTEVLEASGLTGEDLQDAVDMEQMDIMQRVGQFYDLGLKEAKHKLHK